MLAVCNEKPKTNILQKSFFIFILQQDGFHQSICFSSWSTYWVSASSWSIPSSKVELLQLRALFKSELDLIRCASKRLLSRIYDGPTLFRNVLRPRVSYSIIATSAANQNKVTAWLFQTCLYAGHGSSSALIIDAHVCCPLHRVEQNQRHSHSFLQGKNCTG